VSNLPTGTVTFLFTDIEGSTKRWEASPAAMRSAFSRQEDILRHAIEANGGYAYKMIGDAFQAAFPTAISALQAAVDAQHALHAEKWPTDTGEIRVRMALHTGVTDERGNDYVGPVLNRVARLLSSGHGGQVLLTAATYELVRDLVPDNISLFDLGDHRLKDLIRPEHIFQLTVVGLPSQFPALVTLDSQPNNLPRQTTALIGREKEIGDVCALLLRSEVALVTLTGPGGTGKTRLALQVGAELLDVFTDGVWFVELAALTDPDLVLSTVASVLDVSESADRPLVDTLKIYLRDKKILLVLDNFEQVTAAASIVNVLLAGAPNIKILVTSRERLHLYGEWDYQVPPLSLPDVKRLPPIEQLTQYEGVRLFIERAQASKADFEVTNDNAPAVAEICVRLDGLPLAIELAAARIRLLPPQTMLARLQERFKLLSGGVRDRPLRQQTIRNTIAWSYDLLDEEEKKLFRRLGVFQGGATLEAAEHVCDFDGDIQIDFLEGVERLVDRSLVRQQEGHSRESRLSMLETIQEFAREKLAEDSPWETQAVQHAHTFYFVQFVEQVEPHLRGAKQGEWLDRLEDEHDNLRAALHWSSQIAASESIVEARGQVKNSESGAAEIALRIAGGLWRFWYARGYLSEGLEQLVAALALPVPSVHAGSAHRIRALNGAGFLSYRQGNYDEARSLFIEALAHGQAAGDKSSMALTLNGIGMMDQEQGNINAARSYYEQSLALRRELGDEYGIGASLNNLALIAEEQEDYPTARALLEESLALAREQGDTQGIASCLMNSGNVAKDQGDYEAAHLKFEESLVLQRALGNRWGIALALGYLADIAHRQGDQDTALPLYRESLLLTQELGDRRGLALSLEGMASVYGAQGKGRVGAILWGAAEAVREAIGAPISPKELARYREVVGAARSTFGEEAFAKAWEEGGAMSLEEAIDYALHES
jgi:predicted ATPase/class 3 adenylate cyclase